MVNDRPHEIRVDTEPASGKTFIRVDGRMAFRPMTANDDDCEILVDGVPHRVTRTGYAPTPTST